MGWLARLFGRERENENASSDDDEVRSPFADFDWRRAEAGIADLFARDLAEFALAHSQEEFYAVAVDCNSEYGDMLLSANTPQALRKSAENYAENGTEEEICAEERELRWGFGDWPYHGFNYGDSGGYQEYKSLLPETDLMEHPDDREMFMETVARALLSLQKRGVLKLLNQTPDFRVICMDDGEDFTDADERMKRLGGADS